MNEIIKLVVGVIVLALGIPAGNFLAKLTKEELRDGRLWFKIIIVLSCVSAVFSLIWGNDFLLFTFLFIAIVTSRSLIQKKKQKTSTKRKKR